MPEYQSDSGPDLASRLLRENQALTARVTALEGRRPVALDRVEHTTIPAPYEGQIVVELDDTVWYYSNSTWRQMGGSGAITALAIAYNRSQTTGGKLSYDFDAMYWNDASFAYSDVTSSRARYLTISSEGFYRCQYYVSWDTDFTVGDAPYIEPSCELSGVNSTLAGTPSIFWDDTGNVIYGEQLTAAEMDHHQLTATIYFQYTAADVGETPFGLGVNLRQTGSRTKSFGAGMVITKLEGTLATQTIV